MLGEARLLTELRQVVKRSPADGISVCAHAGTRRVFRFADESVHQALVRQTISVTVKVILNNRVGVAGTETLEADSLARCVRSAVEIAKHAPQPDDRPILPAGTRITTRADALEATAAFTPAMALAAIRWLFHLCRGAGATLAGSLVTGDDTFAVVNSAGARCYAASTVAGAKLVTMYRKLSGFAGGVHRDIRRLDLDGLLKRSLRQSLHQEDPVTLPLGTYEVILEPEAVADLVTWLGYTGFGAKSVQERASFLAGRMGERVFDPEITICDDGHDPQGLRVPFDFEGTLKQRVPLIDRGIAAGIVYDTVYGARFRHPSTGHAMPPQDTDGPLPLHLVMAPGRAPLSQMIRACKRGLLIPRFHYVNGLLNPREALMTGLTREGAFLIENGRITKPVSTMRFTHSLLEAFRRVLGVSSERRLIADPSQELGCALMPSLHLAAFQFTGRSEQ